MARTPIAGSLENAAAEAAGEHGLTRRRLLRDAGIIGLAAAGTTAAGRFVSRADAALEPRTVVVGAGLAGLTAAYRLQQAGIVAEVHEASDRVGGRCWTIRGAFAEGQIAEHGGELIDQGHTAIRRLATELGLKLDNLLRGEENGTEPMYYFDGRPYSYAQATDDLKEVWQKIHSDVSAASYPTLYNLSTERGRELDRMSIVDWIEESVPGGMRSPLGQLLDVAYTIEYGADSSEQSSLNLLYLLGYSGQGQLRIFGPSNEKYHVVGGNDQIPKLLADRLAGQITLGSELVAIRLRGDGVYTLTFRQGSSTTTVAAERVILALPFSILRSSVDISRAGFGARKLTAIREMGMGTNSKLHVQFKTRHWNGLDCNGDTFADTGYQNTWEVTRAQPGTAGILVDYTGGTIGASFGSGTPSTRAKQFLGQLEPVLPGISGQWNGRATLDFWPTYPWTKGSYSYWKVGQYTAFAGVEREREGNCHFAGEHTSVDFQGYLNGAVETGERAAGEILADLK
ncbi:MAG TPA: FAD-dependent oxidoreductase [Gaiellaceae bacterium]|nr:FAD-dependent oxidoreductase [Gaiellaceae bacterium]HET8653654.1 FAD-dependent oxidoreductase [Gaiellaceae bacterium]